MATISVLAFSLAPIKAVAAPATSHPSHPATLHLISGQPANVFQASQSLIFKFRRPPQQRYAWQALDWRGRIVAHGIVTPAAKHLQLPHLPLGYYQLRLKAAGTKPWQPSVPFARIADLASRHFNPASPYDVDSAQSWLAASGRMPPGLGHPNPLQPPHADRLISNLEQLAGVSMVRDRFGWNGATNPKPGVFDWKYYASDAKLLSHRGIPILDLFQGTPPWDPWGTDIAQSGPGRDGLKNLAGVYRFTLAAGKRFAGTIVAWECHNETDGWTTPWDSAAFQKAAYLGFKAGDPKATILNAPIGESGRRWQWVRVALRNGMGDYFDVFSFHNYDPPSNYAPQMALARAALNAHSLQNKPIWITETGLAWAFAGRSLLPNGGPATGEMDASEARLQAIRVIKAEVLWHALGAKRIFFFVLPPYNEGAGHKKQVAFGLLRWDWTVKPGYVALANLTWQLANSVYLGRYHFGPGIHAFLFRQTVTTGPYKKRGAQTLVIWANKRQSLTLHAKSKRIQQVNVVGTPSLLRATGGTVYHVTIGPAPIFLNGLRGLKPAQPSSRPSTSPPTTTPKQLTTVLRVRLGKGFHVVDFTAARITHGRQAPATVDVYNFSHRAVTGSVKNASHGCRIQGLPQKVTVPAMGHVQIPFTVHLTHAGTGAGQKQSTHGAALVLTGRFNGRSTDPVVIPLRTASTHAN